MGNVIGNIKAGFGRMPILGKIIYPNLVHVYVKIGKTYVPHYDRAKVIDFVEKVKDETVYGQKIYLAKARVAITRKRKDASFTSRDKEGFIFFKVGEKYIMYVPDMAAGIDGDYIDTTDTTWMADKMYTGATHLSVEGQSWWDRNGQAAIFILVFILGILFVTLGYDGMREASDAIRSFQVQQASNGTVQPTSVSPLPGLF